MFKNILQVRAGGWLLSLSVRPNRGLPLLCEVYTDSIRQFYLKFFFLEVLVSELPY